MPRYFRPWIDRKMLYIDLTTDEMYRRFMYRIPLLGKKIKRKTARPSCDMDIKILKFYYRLIFIIFINI